MGFDVERVRALYPALAEGFVHFDGAAGTLVAGSVADAIAGTLRRAVGNRTTVFEAGRRSGEIVAAARQAVADLVNGRADGVVFGPSATALTYTVARTLAKQYTAEDEIVVSRLDHDANVRPWTQTGMKIRWAEFDPATGELPTDQYRDLINDRTRLVAVTAASNAIGTRPDVAAIADLAHAKNALVYVDGVHATAHLPTDVEALKADFYVTSAYKWSGPHLAACVARPETWERMSPDKLRPSPDTVPDRFEFGTLSFELLAGITAAVDHLAELTPHNGQRRAKIVNSLTEAHAYASNIFEKLLKGLEEQKGVTVLPAPPGRCPTVSFRVDAEPPATTAKALGDQGICVYSGDYYAYEYFQSTGLRDTGGGVRASVYHYNTAAEVDRLLEAVSERTQG